MMRRVLAATDFTPGAAHAVERARRLAALYQAGLVVVHVATEPGSAETHRATLQQYLPAAPHAVVDVRFGTVPDALAEAARDHGADLVVIGLPRRVDFSGSTAERVLLRSEHPVIVVKRTPREDYKRIIMATDFSEPSRAALAAVLRLLPGGGITLVHAYSAPFQGFLRGDDVRAFALRQRQQEAESFIATTLAALPAQDRPAVAISLIEGLAHQVVAREVGRLDADLVVFGTHGRTGVGRAVLGSVAAELLNGIGRDAMLVRPVG